MSLFTTLDVSASGLSAQRQRVEALAQNIANSQTTRTPEGGPYRRREVVFEAARPDSAFERVMAGLEPRFGTPLGAEPEGVRVAEVLRDDSPPLRRYLPDHPDADAEGYVEFPSFNPVEDMVDLTSAVRSYQANLSVVAAVREMINATVNISRS